MTSAQLTQRYILIDSHSGYIWGDTGVVGAATPAAMLTPRDAAQQIDADVGTVRQSYYEHGPRERVDRSHYLVYEAPEGFPEVDNGQDQDLIDAVDERCTLVAKVTWDRADA